MIYLIGNLAVQRRSLNLIMFTPDVITRPSPQDKYDALRFEINKRARAVVGAALHPPKPQRE